MLTLGSHVIDDFQGLTAYTHSPALPITPLIGTILKSNQVHQVEAPNACTYLVENSPKFK
jgi:hypothetical protein